MNISVFFRSILCLLLPVLTAFPARSQEIRKVNLDEQGRDHHFEKSRLIAPVFKLQQDSIETYDKFGIPTKTLPKRMRVKLPAIAQSIDTGYTYVYSGANPAINSGYTAVLVINYGRRTYPSVLFTDHNGNLDFTDDGNPDTFYFNLNSIDIKVRNPLRPDQVSVTRLSRFSFSADLKFKEMADEFYKRYQANRIYTGTDFSFREQRYNIRASQYNLAGDSFSIALLDANYNGIYNDPGIDKILIESYGTSYFQTDNFFQITEGLKECYFERSFRSFKVVSIDSFGRSVSFFYDSSQMARKQLVPGKKVPKIAFRDHLDKRVKLKKYRRKQVYLYFWNRETPDFQKDTAYLRMIQEKYGRQISVVALNYGENPRMLKSFVEFNGITWQAGVASRAIIKQYNLETIPYGFVLKKRLRLYKKGVSPEELWNMLEKGEIR